MVAKVFIPGNNISTKEEIQKLLGNPDSKIIIKNKEDSKELYYYELCFYHDEDDDMATENRCSYCIKTEIPPIISEEIALKILFGNNPSDEHKELMKNLTAIIHISEDEAISYFDMDEITKRVEKEFGVYYIR